MVVQPPATATVAVLSTTAVPVGVAPDQICTRTVLGSPVEMPAVPARVTVPRRRAPAAGWVRVTVGAAPSTVKARGPTVPVLPAWSRWLATTT